MFISALASHAPLISCPDRIPFFEVAARCGCPLHRVAYDAPGTVDITNPEADAIAGEATINNGQTVCSNPQITREHLEALPEFELALGKFPRAFDFSRHDPEIGLTINAVTALFPANLNGLIGCPFPHIEGVGDDARAGLETENRRAKREVETGQEEHGDHRRLGKIAPQDVRLDKVSPFADSLSGSIALRQGNQVGVVLDAERTSATLRRGDDDAAVAGAEVDHVILRRYLRQVQHLFGERLRRRQPNHILAVLALFWLIFVARWRRLREAADGHDSQNTYQYELT